MNLVKHLCVSGLAFGSVGLVSSCTSEIETPQAVLRPVRTLKVYSTGGTRDRVFSGTTEAGVQSVMSFKVSGTLDALKVKAGDQVEKAQLLAALDPTDYSLEVEEAKAALARAQANARNAQAAYARTRLLYENDNASKSQLDADRASSESAVAQVRSASKTFDLAKRRLGYTRLLAPFEGKISRVTVEENENLQSGSPVLEISHQADPEMVFSVPEILIAGVSRNDKAQVTLDSMPDMRFSGVVSEIGLPGGQSDTTFPVSVRILGAGTDKIRPGLAGEVSLKFGSTDQRERFIVPPSGVGSDMDGPYVYVLVDGDVAGQGTVQKRSVTVGEVTSEGLEIFTGLSDGDRVVTAGLSTLTDGRVVRVLPEQ